MSRIKMHHPYLLDNYKNIKSSDIFLNYKEIYVHVLRITYILLISRTCTLKFQIE